MATPSLREDLVQAIAEYANAIVGVQRAMDVINELLDRALPIDNAPLRPLDELATREDGDVLVAGID